MSDFSTQFRKLRIKTGYTQESMADALGLSTSVVNRIESGKRQIKMEEIEKIANATKKTQEEVLNELYGVIVNNTIKENHGTGVSVENSNLKITIELYERIIAEKEKYISYLEKQIEKLEKTI
ncbi:MAG: helix-turn-helix domain-containing protein [Runella sp.]